MARVSRTHPRVNDPNLAREIGARLKAARLKAGLTQQQLAEGRYTKAYVSALENGLSRPSMSALNFFAGRLGLPSSSFLSDQPAGWARLEADVALASGRWDDAVAAYRELLESAAAPSTRAEVLSSLAEALVRRGNGREAVAAASEAGQTFMSLGREQDASLAQYWLAAAQYQLENYDEAKAILHAILARVRLGMRGEPDFEMRVVMALSSVESRAGNHQGALAYLEEVRGLAGGLDDRRRAVYLFDLAYSYRETGDYEAAIRAGLASLEVFRRSESQREMANLENDLALSFLAVGNSARAAELASASRMKLVALGDDWALCHVMDTQARVSLRLGSMDAAAADAEAAVRLAEEVHNAKAVVDSLVTLSQVRLAMGDRDAALAASERAATRGRDLGGALLRKALSQHADTLAAAGRHEEAFAIMREALAIS